MSTSFEMNSGNHKMDEPERGEGIRGKHGSNLIRWLVVLIVLLVISTMVFLGLFVHSYTKYEDITSAGSVSTDQQAGESQATLPTKTSVPVEEICATKECLYLASDLLYDMGEDVDPCDNFYQYACGSFISDGQGVKRNFMTMLQNTVAREMLDILSRDSKEEKQPEYLKTAKHYYNWCLANGSSEYSGNPVPAEDWPTVNDNWKEEDFDLSSLLVKTAQEFIFIPFDIAMGAELGARRSSIMLTSPQLFTTIEQYLEIALEYEANKDRALNDALEVIALEKKLNSIRTNYLHELNFSMILQPLTIREMTEQFVYVNISLALITAFNTAGVSLGPDQQVLINDVNYFDNMDNFFRSASKRAIQNMFEVEYAKRQKYSVDDVKVHTRDELRRMKSSNQKEWLLRSYSLPDENSSALNNFYGVDSVTSSATDTDEAQERQCLQTTLKYFKDGMAKQFMTRSKLSWEEIKKEMYTMKDEMKETMKDILTETEWLSETSRQGALDKLASMDFTFVSPDTEMTDDELNKFYKPYQVINGSTWPEYTFQLNRLTTINDFQTVGQPIRPLTISGQIAAHLHTNNRVEISAGMFDYPLYRPEYTAAMKYGAMGFILGHEMSHGFDITGIQFNSDAQLQTWLNTKDVENFQQKSECMIQQYNAFNISFSGTPYFENGTMSQGENLSDNYGIKLSYRTYKEHVRKLGEEPRLPGLELNNDQLFFLSFGRAMCATDDNYSKYRVLTQSRYALNRDRVIGPLRNFQEFAKAFQCPVGSGMNPRVKCSVWG